MRKGQESCQWAKLSVRYDSAPLSAPLLSCPCLAYCQSLPHSPGEEKAFGDRPWQQPGVAEED